jgi:hypothetical protein
MNVWVQRFCGDCTRSLVRWLLTLVAFLFLGGRQDVGTYLKWGRSGKGRPRILAQALGRRAFRAGTNEAEQPCLLSTLHTLP